MWTTIYNIRFRDDDNGQWLVEVQSPDASATAPVDLTPAGEPLEWRSNGDESQTQTIVSGAGTLRIHVTKETAQEIAVGRLLPTKALDRRVKVTRDGLTVWVGYIQMQTLSQDWDAAPYDIELPLMDTIAALDVIYIDNTETATTTMQLLRHAHAHALQGDNPDTTGNEVGGVDAMDFLRTNLKEYRNRYNSPNGKDWTESPVFPGHYFEPEKDGKPGDHATYSEALDQILSPFGRLTQIGPRWFVGTADVFKSVLYKPNPAKPSALIQADFGIDPFTDISHAIDGTNNNASVLPAPSKVTATYNPEEGAVDFSGDTIIRIDADNIKTNASGGSKEVTWQDDGGTHTLRYMKIGSGNSDAAFLWPVVTAEHHHMTADFYQYRLPDAVTHYRSRSISSGLLSGNPGPWCQVVQNNDGWKVTEAHTLCLRRTFDIVENVNKQGHDYLLKQDIVTLRVLRELVTSTVSVVKLTAKMMTGNLTKEADFSGADHTQEIYHPYVQVFWSATPSGTPSKVLNRNTGGWDDCRGFFFADSVDEASMLPYDRMSHGHQFHLPGNRGYISLRLYASGWTSPGQGAPTISYAGDYDANRGDREWFAFTELKLEYAAWTGTTPTSLLDWNKEYTDDRDYQYNNGTEEVTLNFKTLAGSSPSAATLLAPRWGFCDYAMNVVRSPREMVDIDAVQVTEAGDIPGVTRFSLFQFDGKTYFPAAVGMKARENTVSLKLIRTLET